MPPKPIAVTSREVSDIVPGITSCAEWFDVLQSCGHCGGVSVMSGSSCGVSEREKVTSVPSEKHVLSEKHALAPIVGQVGI